MPHIINFFGSEFAGQKDRGNKTFSNTFNSIGAGGAQCAHTFFQRLFLHEKRSLDFPNSIKNFQKIKKKQE